MHKRLITNVDKILIAIETALLCSQIRKKHLEKLQEEERYRQSLFVKASLTAQVVAEGMPPRTPGSESGIPKQDFRLFANGFYWDSQCQSVQVSGMPDVWKERMNFHHRVYQEYCLLFPTTGRVLNEVSFKQRFQEHDEEHFDEEHFNEEHLQLALYESCQPEIFDPTKIKRSRFMAWVPTELIVEGFFEFITFTKERLVKIFTCAGKLRESLYNSEPSTPTTPMTPGKLRTPMSQQSCVSVNSSNSEISQPGGGTEPNWCDERGKEDRLHVVYMDALHTGDQPHLLAYLGSCIIRKKRNIPAPDVVVLILRIQGGQNHESSLKQAKIILESLKILLLNLDNIPFSLFVTLSGTSALPMHQNTMREEGFTDLLKLCPPDCINGTRDFLRSQFSLKPDIPVYQVLTRERFAEDCVVTSRYPVARNVRPPIHTIVLIGRDYRDAALMGEDAVHTLNSAGVSGLSRLEIFEKCVKEAPFCSSEDCNLKSQNFTYQEYLDRVF